MKKVTFVLLLVLLVVSLVPVASSASYEAKLHVEEYSYRSGLGTKQWYFLVIENNSEETPLQVLRYGPTHIGRLKQCRKPMNGTVSQKWDQQQRGNEQEKGALNDQVSNFGIVPLAIAPTDKDLASHAEAKANGV